VSYRLRARWAGQPARGRSQAVNATARANAPNGVSQPRSVEVAHSARRLPCRGGPGHTQRDQCPSGNIGAAARCCSRSSLPAEGFADRRSRPEPLFDRELHVLDHLLATTPPVADAWPA
jgi:hypothetical protein